LQQRRGAHTNNNNNQLAQIHEQAKTHPKRGPTLEQNNPILATETTNQNQINHFLVNGGETTTKAKEKRRRQR